MLALASRLSAGVPWVTSGSCVRHIVFVNNAKKREFSSTAPHLREMRFVQFRKLADAEGTVHVGLQTGSAVVDLSDNLPKGCHSLATALAKLGGQGLVDAAQSCCRDSTIADGQYELLAPITSPDKLICVGMNYRDHCEEQGAPVPVEPVIFSKFASAIIGPFEDLPYPDVSQEVDWEVELAIVIGKRGKNIPVASAKDHVFGYTVAHDVSARDWQFRKNGGQWLLGKTMDGFCPLGPCVVTADDIPDPHNLALSCRVNGQVKQNSNTKQLVHGVYDIIAWISKFVTLLPGDTILTGTPPGVGCFAKPPQFLKRGDVVECQVEHIGVIRNKVV